MASTATPSTLGKQAYRKSLDILIDCSTQHGFLATPTHKDNYRRVWARDSVIIGLAALLSSRDDLISTLRHSLETLAQYQGPHGEIPSNVDPISERVSYGGTAGRVDADLWFVIGCAEYWKTTRDDDFLESMRQPLEKVRFLLGAWEFNNRGLLYIPATGDWADEYLQSGYVLYDQLLYLQAQRSLAEIHRQFHQSENHQLHEKVARLHHLIETNFWFVANGEDVPEDVYHTVLYEKGREAAEHSDAQFYMPFFTPFGYGFRFDALANSLAILFDVGSPERFQAIDQHIQDEVVNRDAMLLPAFHPTILPKDEDWDDLQISFSHTFKNAPYEYHNGGLWPMVTAMYTAGLAVRGRDELAHNYTLGIHRANQTSAHGNKWSFPEYLHGKKLTAGATSPLGWSATASIIAEKYLAGKRLFQPAF